MVGFSVSFAPVALCLHRYDYRRNAMTSAERIAYTDAVTCLQALPSLYTTDYIPGVRTHFDDFVAVHLLQVKLQHNTVRAHNLVPLSKKSFITRNTNVAFSFSGDFSGVASLTSERVRTPFARGVPLQRYSAILALAGVRRRPCSEPDVFWRCRLDGRERSVGRRLHPRGTLLQHDGQLGPFYRNRCCGQPDGVRLQPSMPQKIREPYVDRSKHHVGECNQSFDPMV